MVRPSSVLFLLIAVLCAQSARAGMTVYDLNDVYRLRMQDISFFLVLLVVCSLILKFLWNHVAKDFRSLPRMKFTQAFCASCIFGLAMLLILTMISGIREVLTPGAWRRQGAAYRLNDPAMESTRMTSMAQLRAAIFDYARSHDGKFPPNDFVPEILEKIWQSPDAAGTRYVYLGGFATNNTTDLIAYEPEKFGEQRFVLFGNGQIMQMPFSQIEEKIYGKQARL